MSVEGMKNIRLGVIPDLPEPDPKSLKTLASTGAVVLVIPSPDHRALDTNQIARSLEYAKALDALVVQMNETAAQLTMAANTILPFPKNGSLTHRKFKMRLVRAFAALRKPVYYQIGCSFSNSSASEVATATISPPDAL